MKRFAIMALAGLLVPAAAAAQDRLSDVLVVERDGGRYLWLALEGQPTGLSYSAADDRLSLHVTGFNPLQAREIVPSRAIDRLEMIALMPAEGGSRVVVQGRFAQPFAELREGGIWISLDAAITGDVPQTHGAQRTASRDALTSQAAADPNVMDASPVHVSASGSQSGGHSGSERSETSFTISPGPEAPQSNDTSSRPVSVADARLPATDPVRQPRPYPVEAAEDTRNGATASTDRSGPDAEGIPVSSIAREGQPAEIAAIAAATAAQSEGQMQQAAPCLDTAMALRDSPWDLAAMTLHADCLVVAEDREGAAVLYERVLAFDPTHFRAALGLARIREAQGRGAEAARLYERAASAALTDGEALAARSLSQEDQSDDDEDGR